MSEPKFYPTGSPPYTAKTHIQDRFTPVDHYSIQSGIATDVARIQHNINTTNLFVSGWMWPVGSGWFKNLDTNYLFGRNIYSDYFNIYQLDTENIDLISFNTMDSELHLHDSAFRNYSIPIKDKFVTQKNFKLNSDGISFNGIAISGSVYPYNIQSGLPSTFPGMIIDRTATLSSGNIILKNNKNFVIENISTFTLSGNIPESYIKFYGFGGHTHTVNKLLGRNITDSNLEYYSNFKTNSTNSDILLSSGVVNTDNAIIDSNLMGDLEVVFQDGTEGSYYVDEEHPSISGDVSNLNLGTHFVASYNNKFYASSRNNVHNNRTYIYETIDFHKWNAISMSGFPNSGSGTILGMSVLNEDLYILGNHYIGDPSDGMDLIVQTVNDASGNSRYLWSSGTVPNHATGFGSLTKSPYPIGMNSTGGKLWIYGYTGPHTISGTMRWDKTAYFQDGVPGVLITYSETVPATSGLHNRFRSNDFMYNKPFLRYMESKYSFSDYISGSDPDSDYPFNYSNSGGFAGLFGNGFNEVTSIIQTKTTYQSKAKSMYQFDSVKRLMGMTLTTDTVIENPLLVFGNAYTFSRGEEGYGLFGGNVPIMADLEPPTSDASGYIYQSPFGSVTMKGSPDVVLHFSASGIYQYIFTPNLFATLFRGYSCYHDVRTTNLNFPMGRSLQNYGFLSFPFCDSYRTYYKHTTETEPTKLFYNPISDCGLLISSGTFPETRDMPTFYDRNVKKGFWSEKTFDWYYLENGKNWPGCPPSGNYKQTYYYSQTKNSIEFNGVIYTTLDYDTGFMYIGNNGSEYIDDEIMYDDLKVFCGKLYGVGNKITYNSYLSEYDYHFTLREFKGRKTIEIPVNVANDISSKYTRMCIHKKNLYIGIGKSKFLVMKPNHNILTWDGNEY